MSVESGIRWLSTTSMSTVQPSSAEVNRVTPSGSRPVRSTSCCMARRAIATGEGRCAAGRRAAVFFAAGLAEVRDREVPPRSLGDEPSAPSAFCRVRSLGVGMGLALPPRGSVASGHQSLHQLLLGGCGVVLRDAALGTSPVDLLELTSDAPGVVVVALRLLKHLLGNPDGPAHRRQGKRQQPGEQAHRHPSGTKSYGAMGPTSSNVARSAMLRATAPAASSRATCWLSATSRETSTRVSIPLA